jgi:hypothetical protein
MKTTERGMSIERLREMFDLDESTGAMRWRARPIHHFKETNSRTAEHAMNRTNSQYAGKVAFTSRHQLGYLRAELGGQLWQAHRVVFALHHGRWPDGDVDHINGDPSDNIPANLRDVPHAINMRNMRLRRNNRSGHPGVRFDESTNKWIADIRGEGKRHHLGVFDSIEPAIAARNAAEKAFLYHENHGRTAA